MEMLLRLEGGGAEFSEEAEVHGTSLLKLDCPHIVCEESVCDLSSTEDKEAEAWPLMAEGVAPDRGRMGGAIRP